MGWKIMESGSIFQLGQEISLPHSAQNGFRPTQFLRAVSLGEKEPDHEADNLSPPSVEVKHVWWYTCTPPYTFMKWCSIKHRDNFSFTHDLGDNIPLQTYFKHPEN